MTRIVHGALALAAAAAAAAAAGCGAGGDASGPAVPAGAAAGTMLDVAVQTRGTTAFVPRTLTAPAGEITIAFTNPSSTPHDLAIAGGGVRAGPTTSVSGGYAAELTVDLPPGTYTYFCTMPGHRQAGMTGTLTVR